MLFNNRLLFKSLFILLFCFIGIERSDVSAQSLKYASQFSDNKNWNFLKNNGQLKDQSGHDHPEIKYYGHQSGVNLFLKKDTISFEFRKADKSFQTNESNSLIHLRSGSQKPSVKNMQISSWRTDLILLNSNPEAEIIGSEKLDYYENFYFSGSDENNSTSLIRVNSCKTITYKNIYPGIDMILSCKSTGLEYSFVIYPGGKVSDIQMKWQGIDSLLMQEKNKGIRYVNKLGYIHENGLKGYLDSRKGIQCDYSIKNHVIGFKSENYDSRKILTIDPSLDWGTFFGGSQEDEIWGLEVDHKNKVVVAGRTFSSSNIVTAGAFETTYNDSGQGFVAKFTDSGQIVWSTYFGGNGRAQCLGVSTDSSENIFITGTSTAHSGLVTSGAYQSTGFGFVAKMDSAGNELWGTYYGGHTAINMNTIKADPYGDVYIGGVTLDRTGIASSGSYETQFNSIGFMGFFAKFSKSGSFLWGSYYGGKQDDEVHGLCTDKAGNLYITGITADTNGIASKGCFQSKFGGNSDAFLAKFNKSGALQWSTYFGDTGSENGTSVAVDTIGNVYLYGNTSSAKGIATPGAYQTVYGGQTGIYMPVGDAFIAEFTPIGTEVWATYFGGPGNEGPTAICYNPYGKIDVTGYTNSTTGISTPTGYQNKYGGGAGDAYLAEFTLNGYLITSTYYGGNDIDAGEAVGADQYGNVFLGGYTYSTNNIATSGAYESVNQGFIDGFISKFDFKYRNDAGLRSFAGLPNILCSGKYPIKVILKNFGNIQLDSVKINWSVNGKIQKPYNWYGNLQPDNSATVSLGTDSLTAGTYSIKAWTSYPNGFKDSIPQNDSAEILIKVYARPLASVIHDSTICPGTKIAIGDSAIAGHTYLWTSNPTGFTSTLSDPVLTPTDSLTKFYLTEINTLPACSKTDSTLIRVSKVPKISAGGDHAICLGNSIIIGSLPVDSNVYYNWTLNGVTTFSKVPDPEVKPIKKSIYYLTEAYLPLHANTCFAKDSAIITVNPLPLAYTGSDKAICTGATTQIGGAAINADQYQWVSFPPGFTSTISDPVVNPKVKTTFILTETNFYGCFKTDSITISIDPNPKPNPGPNKVACSADTVTIGTGSPLTGFRYSWSSSQSAAYPLLPRITIRPVISGWYKLQVTDSSTGCTGKDSIYVFVLPLPHPKISGPLNICTNRGPAAFGTPFDSGSKYSWSINTGKIISGQGTDSIHIQSDSGFNMIRIKETDLNGCRNTDSVYVYTSKPPNAHWKLLSDSPVSVFKAIDTTGQYYHWSFGDGTTGSNILEKHIYPFTKDSTVDVSLTVATAFGCTATYDSLIRIRYLPAPLFYLDVFPTPFYQNTNIKISLDHAAHIQIFLYDDIGRLIGKLIDKEQPENISLYSFNADRYSLASGIYYLRILVDDKAYVRTVVRTE